MTLDEIKAAIDEGRASIVAGQSDEYIALRIAPPETPAQKLVSDWRKTPHPWSDLERAVQAYGDERAAAERKACENVARNWKDWGNAKLYAVSGEIADRIAARGKR